MSRLIASIATGEVQLLRLNEVKKITGMGTTFIYEAMKKGEFPKQIKIGRASRWLSTEIEEWLQEKINQPTNDTPQTNLRNKLCLVKF